MGWLVPVFLGVGTKVQAGSLNPHSPISWAGSTSLGWPGAFPLSFSFLSPALRTHLERSASLGDYVGRENTPARWPYLTLPTQGPDFRVLSKQRSDVCSEVTSGSRE